MIRARLLPILTLVFLTAGIITSFLTFLYPLEIETRESSVWLDVLAMKSGVDIYDHQRVAFLGNTHGPFDPVFKYLIASLFPFLDSWQVIRFAVFLLPYVFLLVAAGLSVKTSSSALLDILYPGSVGFISLMSLGDGNMLLSGRSDPTAILLLLGLLYVSTVLYPKTKIKTAFQGLACGTLTGCIFLTNLRFAPPAIFIFFFTLWQYRYTQKAPLKQILTYAAAYLTGFLGTYSCFLFFLFHFDLNLYYQHFCSYIVTPDKWASAYGLQEERNFTQRYFWPTLVILFFYLTIPEKKKILTRAWAVLCLCVFASCALIYYLSRGGGGGWYFAPAAVTVWFFWGLNYPRIPRRAVNVCGALLLTLYLALSFSNSGGFPAHLAATMKKAYVFRYKVKLIESIAEITSEDSFFFRKSYCGELVDLGDYAWGLYHSGFLGKEFTATVEKHFRNLKENPPLFIITGLIASKELEDILLTKYDLFMIGPDNLIADRKIKTKPYSRLFMRKDFLPPNHAPSRI